MQSAWLVMFTGLLGIAFMFLCGYVMVLRQAGRIKDRLIERQTGLIESKDDEIQFLQNNLRKVWMQRNEGKRPTLDQETVVYLKERGKLDTR